MKATRRVVVMGREISVRSSSSAEKVQAVETFINGKLQEVGSALKSSDAQLVLTLALLNTAEEMLDLRAELEASRSDELRIKGVIEKLEAL